MNTATYAYDPGGNPTTLAGATTQTFGPATQLTDATTAGATTSYTNDGSGNRSADKVPCHSNRASSSTSMPTSQENIARNTKAYRYQ